MKKLVVVFAMMTLLMLVACGTESLGYSMGILGIFSR